MRKIRLITFFLFFLILNQISFAKDEQRPLVDSIAAIVNDDVITKSELKSAVHLTMLQLKGSGVSLPSKNELEKKIMQQLIDKKLQLQIAKQAGITVSESDVDHLVQGIAEQNKVSVAQFYDRINEEGLKKSEYRQIMKDQLLMQRLQRQQISSKIHITPEEITTYLRMHPPKNQHGEKEYAVIDLLLPLSDDPKEQEIKAAKENARQLVVQLKEGKTLAHALQNVQGEANDLGWRKLDDFPSAFVKSLANMKANELSSPIETGNGFHVLKVVDVRQNILESNKLTRRDAENALMQIKINEQIDQLVNKLRSQAYVSIVS